MGQFYLTITLAFAIPYNCYHFNGSRYFEILLTIFLLGIKFKSRDRVKRFLARPSAVSAEINRSANEILCLLYTAVLYQQQQ
jgi:uncharacterized membrane protein